MVVCKKKYLSWLFGTDRNFCLSGSLFGITQQSPAKEASLYSGAAGYEVVDSKRTGANFFMCIFFSPWQRLVSQASLRVL